MHWPLADGIRFGGLFACVRLFCMPNVVLRFLDFNSHVCLKDFPFVEDNSMCSGGLMTGPGSMGRD